MASIVQIISVALDLLMFIVFAHVIMSWLVGFGILDRRNRLVNIIWQELERLLDPIYSRIRRFTPTIGMLDLSPLVLLFGIYAVRIIIANNFGLG